MINFRFNGKNLATLVCILVTANSVALYAQQGIIRGKVFDKQSEVALIGASVSLVGNDKLGTTTDENGDFSLLNVPIGRQTIAVSFVGYVGTTVSEIEVITGKEAVLNIGLMEAYNELQDVVVTSESNKSTAVNNLAVVSARQFTTEEVNRYSGGRSDVARLASNFAGVATSNDSRNDIIVRGNSPSGLLWRIEGIPVPSPNHFSSLGTTGSPVSALNTNVLKNSDFITSAFPAEYGNALGGVFDLGFKKGNTKDFEFTLGAALFPGLEAMAEGPFGKRGGSFVVAGRYSIAQFFGSAGGTASPPNYGDLSFNLDLGKTKIGTITLFGINGFASIDQLSKDIKEDDLYALPDEDGYVKSGFNVVGLTHKIELSKNSYIKTTVGYSRSFNTVDNFRYFNFKLPQQVRLNNFVIDNNSVRLTASTYYNSKISAKLSVRAGALVERYSQKNILDTREFQADKNGDGYPDYVSIIGNSGDYTIFQPFAQAQVRLSNKVTWNAGIHGQQFSLNNQFVIEPRTSLTWSVGNSSSINVGYGLHHQNVAEPLLFLNENVNGTLIQSNKKLDLVRSNHFVIGFDTEFADNLRAKVETYYQQIDKAAVEKLATGYSSLTEGAEFVFATDKAGLVSKGTGFNRGIEFTLEKFYSKGYHALITSSLFQSKYKGSDGRERNTPFNNGYILNVLAGKEFKIGSSQKNVFFVDTKVTVSGGRYYTPVDLEASKTAGFEVRKPGEEYSQQYKGFFRMDLKLGVKFNSANKKSSHRFYIDFQNITDNKNTFRFQYNRVKQRIDELNQLGFFPDFGYKFQF